MRGLISALLVVLGLSCVAQASTILGDSAMEPNAPDTGQAQRMFGTTEPVRLIREDSPVPGWTVVGQGDTLGYIGSSWEITGSIGYSGRPIDMLVAIDLGATIVAADLMQHNEPILTLGLSDEDIAAFVGGFAGVDLAAQGKIAFEAAPGVPDIISRATVSTGVIRDAILRTGRTLALGHGLIPGTGGVDRIGFSEQSWEDLVASGALAHVTVSLRDARAALDGGKTLPPDNDGDFIDLWVALLDPPTIGRNLLGQQSFTQAIGNLGLGDSALFVASRGLHSHRGVAWRRSGVFDRIAVVQGGRVLTLTGEDYLRIDRLAAARAPEFKERSVFRLTGEGFDPTAPFDVIVTATRPAAAGDGTVEMTIPVTYQLPAAYRLAPEPEPTDALWRSIWAQKRPQTIAVAAMLGVLTLILFLQESFVKRPKLWRWGRIGFLSVTLVWLGWIANGQLSVVQVVAFLHSLLSGFRWETFLMEPVIFLLWGFVALGLLFWGRGVYCGWLCPFGALQELTNEAARALKIPQITVPYSLHERLWALKYTLFIAIVALSFYSMEQALILAEAEPFKTAISMRFLRAWPFVAFVVALLIAGLFIERFYCRYLCPLGAGLAIPAKLKLFDWLRRRPQCGRECRLCEQKCTVGAIDPIGRINPNECIMCLQCQSIFHDDNTCTVLKGRKARAARAQVTPQGTTT